MTLILCVIVNTKSTYDCLNINNIFLFFFLIVLIRDVESESRPELESVGVDHIAWSLSRSWRRWNFADSRSGLESQDTNRQQGYRWFWPKGASSRKNWKAGRKDECQCGDKIEASFSGRISPVKGYGRQFEVIAIVVRLCQQIQRLSHRTESR